MRFAMVDTNTEHAYNCIQSPYMNFKYGNAKIQALCNRKPEYENCIQLNVVSLIEFEVTYRQKLCLL